MSLDTLLAHARPLLSAWNSQLPESLLGVDRQSAIARLIDGKTEAERKPLRLLMEAFLYRMPGLSASDIDFGGEGSRGLIWYRSQGNKRPDPTCGQFSRAETDLLIQNFLMSRQRTGLVEDRNLDMSYTLPGEPVGLPNNILRFRCDIYFDLGNLAFNARAINAQVRPIQSLEFHPNVLRSMSLLHEKRGLTLITGITGSGKSTTLDSIIDANNRSIDSHIVIIGSPIEYIHQPVRCILRHREVGKDTRSFKHGTIEALRQDPDIIVVGEMRDPETILACLEVTDSGHKTFSTLHTSSAVESIDRIIGECPPIEQERVRLRLADVLSCVVSQKLVPTVDGKRCLAKEVMLADASVRAAIKNNNASEIYQMMAEGNSRGMNTLEQDLVRLTRLRRITQETAVSYANNKKRIEQLFQSARAA